MKKLNTPEELIGKTIQRTVAKDDKYFLFFSDETFCIIATNEWTDGDIDLDDGSYDIIPNLDNYYELYEIGLIDDATKRKFSDLALERYAEKIKNSELKQLEELKVKYPDAK